MLDTTEYLPRLDQCARVVSDACTKLAIQFSKPPLPSAQDCGVICSRLENAVLVLVSTCNVFPEAQGNTRQLISTIFMPYMYVRVVSQLCGWGFGLFYARIVGPRVVYLYAEVYVCVCCLVRRVFCVVIVWALVLSGWYSGQLPNSSLN